MKSFYSFEKSKSHVNYSQKVDIYAFSIVMHELLTHEPPWASVIKARRHVFEKVAAGERPPVPDDRVASMPDWYHLMRQCWHQDAERRPSFEEAYRRLIHMREQEEARVKLVPRKVRANVTNESQPLSSRWQGMLSRVSLPRASPSDVAARDEAGFGYVAFTEL